MAVREGVSQPDLDGVLDEVLELSGADAAELFVREPGGGRLWLAAHRGIAARDFRARTVFDMGEGYPGLVAQTGEPILTANLGEDPRFVRRGLQRRGFRCFHGVPVTGAGGEVMGTLHLVARHRDPARVGRPQALADAARRIAGMLELGQLRAKDAVSVLRSDAALDATRNLELRLRRALEVMADVTGASGGIVLLREPRSGALHPWAQAGAYEDVRSAVAGSGHVSYACSVISERSGAVGSSRAGEGVCRCSVAPSRYGRVACVPLVDGEEVLGAVSLGFTDHGPLPGRLLAVARSMAERLAADVADAQAALAAEQRAIASRELRMRGELDELLERGLRPAMAELSAGAGERLEAVERALRSSALEIAGVNGGGGDPAGAPSEAGAGDTDVAADPAMLDIRCFGRLTVFRAGERIDGSHLRRSRAWRLLKILLTRYGSPVDDDVLIEWLWPEGPGPGAAAQLKVLVHDLRRTLEPVAPASYAGRFVVRSGHGYAFDTASPHRVDSRDFATLMAWGERLAHLGEVDSALVAYRAAADLYADDFLADELYADWCVQEREELCDRFLTLLRHTATLLLARGELEGAIACHRRALRVDDTQEDAHRELMRLLWEAGRVDEARRQYASCREALARAPWREPQPRTVALAELIGAVPGS
ncbi:MAG: GAF domain-containing protein [Solirubrobacteraceae bacterium]